MSNSEEKIFDGVPSYDGSSDHLFEIELAKAGGSVTERKALRRPSSVSEEIGDGVLTLDVYRTPDEVVVESAIAGVKPEDIDINVTADSITIKGERVRTEEIKDENYDLQECYWGRFSRSVILPEEVDAENAKAEFENGILTVRMPKRTRPQAKKLQIRLK
ncbi:MAG: Hsp20/alpha crystallin family protein [Candidatus Liptonbacteria bacterium]|nr:Hsp20/alpha crystallin family protein [Candidatus Liptonbacteria bacterium]